MPDPTFPTSMAKPIPKVMRYPTMDSETLKSLVAAFRPVGIAARRAVARLEPLCRLLIEAKRGSPIGRKRRARRARGRRRYAH